MHSAQRIVRKVREAPCGMDVYLRYDTPFFREVSVVRSKDYCT